MSSPDRPLRIITESNLAEIAEEASRYFGGLNLAKMLEIAHEESAIDAEYRVVEDSRQLPSNPVTQVPSNLTPEVSNG